MHDDVRATSGAKRLRGGLLFLGALVIGYLAGGMHPAVGSVVAGPSSQIDATELEGLMREMENGLAEMSGSAEQMMAALTTSPRVRAAAEPKVAAMLADPALQEEVLRIVREMQQTLHGIRAAMDAPETREALVAHARLLESKVQEVAAGMEQAPGRRLEAAYAAPGMRAPAAPRAGVTEMKGVKGLLYGGVKTADGDLYGNFFEKQAIPAGSAIKSGDVGTTFPLGVYDPLNLIGDDAAKYRRWQEMEIKHGRLAMAAFVHVIVTEAGIRWPGYLSDGTFGGEPIKFADMPGGTLASWAAMPPLGWAQIIAFIGLLDSRAIQEGLPEDISEKLFGQDPNRAPGDVASQLGAFKRYDDKGIRDFKLNVERNNGRAAMFGIIGMIIHEALTGNPLFPFSSV